MRVLIATALLCLFVWPVRSHESWISKGGLKNGAGEWCCGEGDCAVLDAGAVRALSSGYWVLGYGTIGSNAGAIRSFYNEAVPYPEAQPSPDGLYWRCKRPDGTRRCFFAPPPAM